MKLSKRKLHQTIAVPVPVPKEKTTDKMIEAHLHFSTWDQTRITLALQVCPIRFSKEKHALFKSRGHFKWLHYSPELNALVCYYCAKANSLSLLSLTKNSEHTFISTGFTYWKNALQIEVLLSRAIGLSSSRDFATRINKSCSINCSGIETKSRWTGINKSRNAYCFQFD